MDILDTDINEGIKDITKVVDESFESEDERQRQLTDRLRIDMTSPHKLPQLIRPISFIWAMGLQTILSIITLVMAFNSSPIDSTSILAITGSNTAILTTMIGFYFSSRRAEKINAKRVEAAIDINRQKSKVEIGKAKSIAAIEIEKAEIEVEREELKLKEEQTESKLERRQDRREARRERRERNS